MSLVKKQLFILFITISMTGCSSVIKSSSSATPQKSSSKFKKEEPSEGSNNFLMLLGMTVLLGTIYAVAPKEAYK